MTQLNQNPVFNEQPIDLLVGGTPCQSFSVAGLRKGLADPRGNLMLTFLSIADKRRPKWIVWENVPGVLSSNGGRDFGTFLGALGELGYGFAYRVLDAQFFGVAQRRRRVFVVGYLGDWRPAAAVLFESESLQRDSKPSRAKRKETPSDAEGSVRATGFAGNVESQVAACLQTTCDDYSRADGFNTVIEQVAQPIPINTMTVMGRPSDELNPRMGIGIGNPNDPCPTLTKAHHHAVAQPIAVDTYNYTTNEHTTQTIRSQSDTEHIGAVLQTMAIRRLTPKECERLQGFPDDWTKIPYRNKPADQCPDGPRYKACGNSMAVPVMRWIGTRIQMIENYLNP
jgi:DNA (cytosine-5)-methyltransferase 1